MHGPTFVWPRGPRIRSMKERGDLRAGATDALPFLLGVVPFALVAGIAAVEAGLTPIQAIGMSVFVFAGASQLAALELIGENAPLAVVVVTGIIINLRMLMYSASIAPYFAELRRRTRLGLAYLLTDQAYAMSVAEFERNESRDRVRYYVGLGGTIWVVWVLGTAVGVFVGAGLPPALELSFAVPLVFLALLVPAMKDRPTTIAGVVAGAVAVAASGAPFNLGLLAGSLAGIAAGIATPAGGGRP